VAADDCAVLVGIARYFESSTYPPLQGPVHDVASVYEWLISKSGGDVPEANIRKLVTDKGLFDNPNLKPEDVDLSEWKPSLASITSSVFSLISISQDMDSQMRRSGAAPPCLPRRRGEMTTPTLEELFVLRLSPICVSSGRLS